MDGLCVGRYNCKVATGLPSVLVVDDEVDVRDLLEYGLRVAGFDVTSAADGDAALCRMTRIYPDVILLDLALPDVDGFALLEQLRILAPTPIVILSARTGRTNRTRSKELGARDYITKPFDMGDLIERLNAAIGR